MTLHGVSEIVKRIAALEHVIDIESPRSVKTADIYWGAISWIGTMVVPVAT
jgi:TRAP-type mannitol/chloroaromatic compound transport system permease large subunit